MVLRLGNVLLQSVAAKATRPLSVLARHSQHTHCLLIMDTFFSIAPVIPAESSVETLGELLADQEHGGMTTDHSGCVLAW